MFSKRTLAALLAAVVVLSGVAAADGAATTDTVSSIVEVQKYYRAIHIMAMLLVGFGFLMVFVKKYGRSAVTATYLLVSVAIPLYFVMDAKHFLGGTDSLIDRMILAEFGAASLLICAGALLGRLKMSQYMLLGLLFVPCYAFNEWIVLDGGFGLVPAKAFVDTGGSIVIHAFGAVFGIAAMFSLTTRAEYEAPIESDATSDRFSLLGSMVLWIFWPSFCAALVPPADIPETIVNVIIALCGSTLATFFASSALRKKVSVADMANAALAGGVAIGSTCDKIGPAGAFLIGILAGALSTFGFAVLQGRFQDAVKKVDTCGVLYLHGLPGLLGGLAALFAVTGIDTGSQVKGIGTTLLLALVAGAVVGKVVSLLGRKAEVYVDADELDV